MAKGQPIQYSDLADPNAFKQLTADVKALDAMVKILVKDLTAIKTALQSNPLTSGKGLENYNTSVKKTVEITKDLTTLEKQKLSLNKKLSDGRKQAATENAALAHNLSEQNRINKEDAKILNTKAGSMARLSIELAKNKRKYRELSAEQRNNVKVGGKLLKSIQSQDKNIKKLDKSLGDNQRNVGNYGSALQGVTGQFGMFGAVLPKVQAGLKMLKVGFTTLKGAIISTGIGALVVALGSLVAYFSSSEEAAAKFQKIISPFKVLFGNLSDLFVKMGENLVAAFENPQQAAADLWEAIKSNIVVRIESTIEMFGLLGKTIAHVFKGEFTEAGESVKQAGLKMVDSFTGIEDTVGKATEAITEFAAETVKETKQAEQLALATLKLKQDERAVLVENAKLARIVALARLDAAKKDKFSAQERIDLMDKAAAATIQMMENEESLAIRRLEFSRLEHSFSVSNQEDLEEEARLEAELINLQTQNALKLKKLESEKQTAIRETLALQKTQIVNADESIKATEDEIEAYLDADMEGEAEKLESSIKSEGDTEAQIRDDRNKGLENTSALLKQVGEDNKITSLASATINSYLAGSQVLSDPTLPTLAKIPAMIGIIASGLKTVAGIAAVGFWDGTENVIGGVRGRDSVSATLAPGERVVTVAQNKPLLAMGISNNELPGMVALGKSFQGSAPQLARMMGAQIFQQSRTNEILKSGLRFVAPDGSIRNWKDDKIYYN